MQDDWNRDVRRFWFTEIQPEAWFRADPEIDAAIRMRFLERYRDLRNRPVATLVDTPEIGLAAVIVLDQFPRNMFRGTPEAFAAGAQALALAEAAIAAGHDRRLDVAECQFLYMPFQHSEDLEVQRRSVALFAPLGPELLDYAKRHLAIIEQFGRFPHRNDILGRASTAAEIAFLKTTPPF
ncbi:MAG TPA: DUF924 family protein [Sphingomonas sp.]|nr:DUF924 family protein [Sphingomonas sp.]